MPAPRNISPEGVEFIKGFEQCRLDAYPDGAHVWTIGWGHSSGAGPPHVESGMKISQEEADGILKADLQKFVSIVNGLLKVEVAQGQFDALVSFEYNTGALGRSTLLKRVNAKQWNLVPAQFLLWDHADGVKLAGLTRRRQGEVALWNAVDGAAPVDGGTPVEMAPPEKTITTSKIAIGSVVTGVTAAAGAINAASDQINQAADSIKHAGTAIVTTAGHVATVAEPFYHLPVATWYVLAGAALAITVGIVAERLRHLHEDRI